jgi:hypothetical protein
VGTFVGTSLAGGRSWKMSGRKRTWVGTGRSDRHLLPCDSKWWGQFCYIPSVTPS